MKTAIYITLAGLALAAASQAQKIKGLTAKLGESWSNMHPEMQRRALQVIERATREFAPAGLTVGVYQGWRDVAEQLKQIEEGDSWVKDPLNSYHPWGLAADFVFIDSGGRWTWLPDESHPDNTSYWSPQWDRLGVIIERAGLEWGGRWRHRDGPHGQLPVSLAGVRARYSGPADFIAARANDAGLPRV